MLAASLVIPAPLVLVLLVVAFAAGGLAVLEVMKRNAHAWVRTAAHRAAQAWRRQGYFMRAALVEDCADALAVALVTGDGRNASREYIRQMRERRRRAAWRDAAAASVVAAVLLPGCGGGEVLTGAAVVLALSVVLLLGRDAARAVWCGVRSVVRHLPRQLARERCGDCGRKHPLWWARQAWGWGLADARTVAALRLELAERHARSRRRAAGLRAAGVLQ